MANKKNMQDTAIRLGKAALTVIVVMAVVARIPKARELVLKS